MEETISGYIDHYLKTSEGILFFAATLITLVAIVLLLYAYTAIRATGLRGREKRDFVREEFNSLTERFYELIFSGGSILFFMAAYYLINRFYFIEPYRSFWDKYNDFLLLLLIVISILINRIVDNVLIRLRYLKHEDKASIRLVGMVYMILIFCYIKFIYENNNYDMFISYFVGLMIGRFVYFDVSIHDFTDAIKSSVKNIPLMILALGYLGLMSYYGFKTQYLIKHIGVITNVFFIHVFMTVAIFIVFHIYHLVAVKPKRRRENE